MTTPPRPVIALFLPDAANEYQEMVRDDACGRTFLPGSLRPLRDLCGLCA